MGDANLYALFRSRFPGDATPFLETDDGVRLRYSEVDERSGRILALLEALGVRKGDRVIAQVDKSPQAVLLYLACLRRGAIYIPLNTAYTPAEVRYFLADAEPALFVVRPETVEVYGAMAKALGVPHVLGLGADGEGTLTERSGEMGANPGIEPCAGDDLAAILYTSGTTGRSKGAMLSHRNLAANALTLHRLWGWRAGDVLLHALPIYHVHGLFVALHCALLGGSPVLFLPRFDAGAVLRLLPRATVFMGVPTFYTRLLEEPGLDRAVCRNMRLFIAGSAPLLADTFAAFAQRTGHRILERYGMTEAGMITSNPYDGERVPGTVGFPLPDVEARVVDEAGNEVARGRPGVLEIRGPNVFGGYWRMPDKTAAEFRGDGFFVTGDVAVMAADGRVSIVGRAKDLIISGGFNVYPKEIEDRIDAVPGVKESAVIGLPHPDFGEAVAAVVVGDDSAPLTEATILAHLSGELARFKQPKRVFFVDELPRNTMGKVQKNELRDRYAGTFAERGPAAAR
ncbi:MAG: malonyl-CoA synthase [Rhodospirillales bacterium]